MKHFRKEERSNKGLKVRGSGVFLLLILGAALVYSAYLSTQGGFFNVHNFGSKEHFSYFRVCEFILVVLMCGCISVIRFRDRELEHKSTRVISWLAYAVTPVVVHVFLEYANPAGRCKFLMPANWLQPGCRKELLLWVITATAVLYLCMLLFYAITCNVRIASILLCITAGLFGLSNYYVYQFRGTPVLASDITTLQTAINVAGGYSYHLNLATLVMVLGLFYWCVLLCKLPKKRSRHKITFRLVVLLVSALVLGGSVYGMMYTELLTDGGLGLTINSFAPIKSYKRQGQVLTYVRSFKLLVKDVPEGYSPELAAEIAQPYIDAYNDDDAEYMRPNVICIMDEALTDFSQLGDFKTTEDAMPYYHSLKKNTSKGMLNVSVFGGKTANTEFEFLTGITNGFMPKSTTPYQLFINDDIPSLARNMEAEGYTGIKAFHPYKESGYNRVNVYPYMGFHDFISVEDFELTDDMKVANHMSDKESFKMIISEYEKTRAKSDDPFFMFTVTMQNHSPYIEDFDDVSPGIEIKGALNGVRANRYINLVRLTDDAIKELLDYFKKVDEPTIVVLFGDHEPEFSDKFYSNLLGKDVSKLTPWENMDMFKTASMIWTNYDTESEADMNTSSNYLSMVMKQKGKMRMSPYDRFLAEMSKQVPVITENGYIGADGKYYEIDDENSPYYEYVYKYRVMVYNYMFDGRHRVEGFFY